MRLLVCGSAPRRRPPGAPGWTDYETLERVLNEYLVWGDLVLIEGGALGADRLAREWAETNGIPVETYEADWSRGRGAGPIRNRRMLADGAPDLVIGFSTSNPPTSGTAGMLRLATDAGVPCRVVFEP